MRRKDSVNVMFDKKGSVSPSEMRGRRREQGKLSRSIWEREGALRNAACTVDGKREKAARLKPTEAHACSDVKGTWICVYLANFSL